MNKKPLLILCALVMCLSIFAAPTAKASLFDFLSPKNEDTVTISREEYNRLMRYSQMDLILQYIEKYYYQEPDVDLLIEDATRALLYGLEDPYSFYYNPQEWSDLWADDEGEYGGIGIQLLGDYEKFTVTITRVFKDTPAQRAGLQKGDVLVRVEDIEVNAYTMQDAVNLMRGTVQEEVEIEVYRGNEYLVFSIPRDLIHINRIEYTLLEDKVGYIILYEFAGESQAEFREALTKLKAQGATSLILDLRDNGGGWVDAALEIADLFLDNEQLVYTMDRYGNRDNSMRTKPGKDDIPLVILVNENSASSSEILAGGLQALNRATLVGVKTFGKGIVQAVISLDNDKSGFQLTYAQYFLPNDAAVHKVGLTPDILLEMPQALANKYFELGDMEDPQLQRAWEEARSLAQ